MSKAYKVTIERTETTIIEVEADSVEAAELAAWMKWNPDDFGLAESNITGIEEVTE
jgi:hypothetical protein